MWIATKNTMSSSGRTQRLRMQQRTRNAVVRKAIAGRRAAGWVVVAGSGWWWRTPPAQLVCGAAMHPPARRGPGRSSVKLYFLKNILGFTVSQVQNFFLSGTKFRHCSTRPGSADGRVGGSQSAEALPEAARTRPKNFGSRPGKTKREEAAFEGLHRAAQAALTVSRISPVVVTAAKTSLVLGSPANHGHAAADTPTPTAAPAPAPAAGSSSFCQCRIGTANCTRLARLERRAAPKARCQIPPRRRLGTRLAAAELFAGFGPLQFHDWQ
eukprot:SAG31_NODE_965_length_10696_cov_10.487213_3_plen_269_part_00